MTTYRIALANLRYPATPDESVVRTKWAITEAAKAGAQLICFPECYVPGYRAPNRTVPPPNQAWLECAWADIASAARDSNIAVVLGTERVENGSLLATALVIHRDGTIAGSQDKVQLDPSEDGLYGAGADRHMFQDGPLTFGIAICHEGWRYPETVRWAARRGAHVVFHPHFAEAEPGDYVPTAYADPANSFHEKAALCRAAENSCYFATVNYASDGSPTTSAIGSPDGTALCYQPYGVDGLLLADLDLSLATGLLATRSRYGA
jgi:predicted amidohydrolase